MEVKFLNYIKDKIFIDLVMDFIKFLFTGIFKSLKIMSDLFLFLNFEVYFVSGIGCNL